MGTKQPCARTEPFSTGGVPQVVVLGWPDLERMADAVTVAAAGGHDPSPSHAYDLIRSGTIPHLRLGRGIVIPRRDLDAMIRRGAGGQAAR